jgi:hypothetical protein
MSSQSTKIVKADFLIAIRRNAEDTGLEIATRALADAMEEHWEEGAASRAWEFIREEFQRDTLSKDQATGKLSGPIIYGFQIELIAEVKSPALIIKDVSEALRRDQDVEHVLKFYDSIVEERNINLARELFVMEMRMRRAITLIYLHAYGGTYYDLLRNDKLGTDSHLRKRMPKPETLNEQAENEFFHLLFNHYGELNILRETRQLDDFIKQLVVSPDFVALQRELQRLPVEEGTDRDFLNRIKKDLNPVETLRNCVMHNRTPTDEEISSYETARDALNLAMDELFERWTITSPYEDEMPWDTATREAVENALENAHWDDSDKTITLFDFNGEKHQKTVSNREDLEQYLSEIAATAFYANAPRDNGEFVFECDEDGIVESALSVYEDRLSEFFNPGDTEQ